MVLLDIFEMYLNEANHKFDRWTLIEFEGRMISSLVAMFVYYLSSIGQTHGAVGIFMISQMFDLIRCAYRKHLLEPGIVAHHCMSIAICTSFLNSEVNIQPDVILATQKLLGMEFTNPFLHGAWMIAKVPQLKHRDLIEVFLLGLVISLWPYFRLYGSFKSVVLLAYHHVPASFLAAVLCGLQGLWFYKLIRRFAQLTSKDRKTL